MKGVAGADELAPVRAGKANCARLHEGASARGLLADAQVMVSRERFCLIKVMGKGEAPA